MKRRFLFDTGAPAATSAPAPATAVAPLALTKGQNINISKDHATVTKVGFGMSWSEGGAACDPDASALLVGANGKLIAPDEHAVIFFNHLTGLGVTHSGDNRTGSAPDDDEVITVDLSTLDPQVDKAVLVCTIYDEAAVKNNTVSTLNFGQTKSLSIRVFDAGNPDHSKNTIAKFDLSEDFSAYNTLIFGELYRKDGELKFRAIGEGGTGDLNTLRQKYS